MHGLGSAIRLHEVMARTTIDGNEGELNSSRGPGGFLQAASIVHPNDESIQ